MSQMLLEKTDPFSLVMGGSRGLPEPLRRQDDLIAFSGRATSFVFKGRKLKEPKALKNTTPGGQIAQILRFNKLFVVKAGEKEEQSPLSSVGGGRFALLHQLTTQFTTYGPGDIDVVIAYRKHQKLIESRYQKLLSKAVFFYLDDGDIMLASDDKTSYQVDYAWDLRIRKVVQGQLLGPDFTTQYQGNTKIEVYGPELRVLPAIPAVERVQTSLGLYHGAITLSKLNVARSARLPVKLEQGFLPRQLVHDICWQMATNKD